MTDHLVEVDRDWSLWRELVVRGAGFPAADVLRLASPQAAAAADAWLARDRELDAARTAAIAALRARLATARGKDRNPIVRALRAVDAGTDDGGDAAMRGALDAREAARLELDHALEVDRTRIAAVVADLARDPRFREALTWQNRDAVHRVLDRVDASTASKARQNHQLVARYLQRYCTKNDSIGFFGPTGWGTFGGDAPIRVAPGPALIRSRTVYLEYWGVDALATALAADRELLLDAAPRLSPTVRVDGTRVHYGAGKTTAVSERVAEVLAVCTGERSARDLAAALGPGVDALLEELAERELVIWTLEVAAGLPHPEVRLRELVAHGPASPARERALAAIAELATARDAVASARDPGGLERELGELDRVFTALTGGEATRRRGEMYAGRTLVYLDCRRDLELELGGPVLARLGAVLAPVLAAARWYTFEIARRYRGVLEDAHRELGGGTVDYLRFWQHVAPHFPADQTQRSPIVDAVAGELGTRWRDLLGLAGDTRRIARATGELVAAAARAFVAPGPGWPSARHLSPDLMIAARDVSAIEAGAYAFVLGELHIGNTLMSFADQHPDPGRLVAASDADLAFARAIPVDPKLAATGVDQTSRSPDDFHVELGPSRSWRSRDRVLRAADLRVERAGASLEVVDPTRGLRFDIIAFLDPHLTLASSSHFRIGGEAPHLPRVTVDDFVLVREQWRLDDAGDGFARSESPAERFAGARRWQARHGFPRRVFAKVPTERKPIYVDFDSPILVDMLAKLLRTSPAVAIAEMLPDVTEAWLPDADGNRYTSELRIVAVDARPWRSAITE